jgi:predicted small secreted protein
MGIHLIPQALPGRRKSHSCRRHRAARAMGHWEIAMKMAFAALTFLLAAAAAACNTVQGMGKDVSAAGGAIDDAAEEAKK